MFRILIAEDDPSTARLLCAIVKRAGYEPLTAADGVQALEMLDHNQIDLLLCDVMMPRMDGFTLTRTIRESGSMLPILMLTAKDMPQDKHTGFIVGTDDYMTKPPDRQELVLRIKALLRRARIVDEHRITIGDVELDYDTHTVRRGHDAQVLPPKEFNLLYKLLAYPERTFTRLELLDDARFAAQKAAWLKTRHKSRREAQRQLAEKGVDRNLIDEALDEVDKNLAEHGGIVARAMVIKGL